MKNCSKCKEVKSYEFFNKNKTFKDGCQTICRSCMKEYQSNKKEYFKEYQKHYYIKNKEKAKEYVKHNKEKIKKYQNEYKKNRLQNDSIFKFGFNLRCLIRCSFKRNNNKFKKNTKTEKILGCTIEEFKNYILTKFTKKMTFENYGEWHLDHIIPISSATTEEELIILNHYTNFQPMWAKENISKGNKIIEKQLTLL